jgi:Nuclease A inhibitor-like protein
MSNNDLVQQFKTATDRLLFMSESDYPFEVHEWENLSNVTPDHLKQLTGLPADTPIEETTVDNFFRPAVRNYEGQSEIARSNSERYRQLLQLIHDNLTDATVYKLGTINMPVFIVGKTRSGNWMALSTRVVET